MLGLVSRRTLPLFGAAAVVASLTLSGGVTPNAAAASHAAAESPHIVYGNFDELSNWGGYATQGTSKEFTSVTASWTEPTVTCRNDNSLYAPWVGIDGFGNETVEQTGVQTYCATGKPVDSAWYEMYPKNPVYYNKKVKAGDAITATVTASGDDFTLTISDSTEGWTETTHKTLSSATRSTAEAVIESPTVDYPKIKSVKFTSVEFNGAPLDSYSLTALSTDSGTGTTVYKPSAITDTDDFSMLPN
jgi:Peptidase A4 family